MKLITDLKSANFLLNEYKSAKCHVFIYSINLKRLALRLMLPDVEKVVYVIGIGCEHITGHFTWNNADLSILIDKDKESGECSTRIIDGNSGFELITSGGFALAQGIEEEFGNTFNNFLKHES